MLIYQGVYHPGIHGNWSHDPQLAPAGPVAPFLLWTLLPQHGAEDEGGGRGGEQR